MNDPEDAAPARNTSTTFPGRPSVRIENPTGIGFKTRVFIDGVDISSCVFDVEIHAGIKDAVTATMKVLVSEFDIDGAHLKFPLSPGASVTDYARELLVSHGWTPPSDEP